MADEEMVEPMSIEAPKVMDLVASGVPVGKLSSEVEFDYTLKFDQNIEIMSTVIALKQYFRRAKKESVKAVYLRTIQNSPNESNTLRIITERITD